jgi:hypothetical protein
MQRLAVTLARNKMRTLLFSAVAVRAGSIPSAPVICLQKRSCGYKCALLVIRPFLDRT